MNLYNRINKYFINKYYKIYKLINGDKKPVQLGRWNMTDLKKTNIKIDYANEDHCGTCLIIKNDSIDSICKNNKNPNKSNL